MGKIFRSASFRQKAVLSFCAVFLTLIPGMAFSLQQKEFRTVAVITREEISGPIREPAALFFDEAKKRLYVSDSLNNRLVSYDENFQDLSELTDENFALPMGIAKTPSGEFLIVDGKKGELKLIDVQNMAVRPFIIINLPPGHERFIPGRFAMDSGGRLYVIDRLNKRIIVAEPDGTFIRAVSPDSEDRVMGLNDVRVDDRGYLYAVDTLARSVYVFDDKGSVVSRFGRGMDFPVSVAVTKKGLIYVLDRHAGKILVFDAEGREQYELSRKGMGFGELYNPSYIFIDGEGRIYAIDGARIQVFEEGK